MSETQGIKEIKEAMVGVNELALKIIPILKDGISLDDVPKVVAAFSDAGFLATMKAAMDSIEKVPAEVADLTLPEGVELSIQQISYIPKYIEALKK